MNERCRGAYGLRLGPPVEDSYLVDAPADWPAWELAWSQAPSGQGRELHIGDDYAVIDVMPEGRVLIERATRTSTFFLPAPPSPEAWAHPHLSSTAVIAAWWHGRRSFHAGAFVAHGGAWGIVGERGDGKTSMLAWLSTRRYPIVCDDILVIDGNDALAGPRCFDLRQSAAEHFGLGTYIGHVGTRERWRASLPPVPDRLPLRGWVIPAWADEVCAEPLKAADRLPVLLAHRGLRIPESGGHEWLDLVARPMVRFQRPQDWSEIDGAMGHLLDKLATF